MSRVFERLQWREKVVDCSYSRGPWNLWELDYGCCLSDISVSLNVFMRLRG